MHTCAIWCKGGCSHIAAAQLHALPQERASYEVAEDAMKLNWTFESCDCGETLDCAIRMMKSKNIIFISTSPFSQIPSYIEKVCTNSQLAMRRLASKWQDTW